jgi:class 3 adenylate cyclase
VFELLWNLVCPGCGCILDGATSLKQVKPNYVCHLCVGNYEPTLDELVEVSFTVSPTVRKIPFHQPETVPRDEYMQHLVYSSAIKIPHGNAWHDFMGRVVPLFAEIPPYGRFDGEVTLDTGWVGAWEPITHGATFFEVTGEPASELQEATVDYSLGSSSPDKLVLRPGRVRVVLTNKTERRILPGLYKLDHELHEMFEARHGFLTAKRLLTNQTFRDVYRTDTLEVDQRIKIASLTLLFTDLKGSTEMYDRVGDLVAYELVKSHFGVLSEAVRANGGAVVKTIGDAVMATFPTPERGLAAAIDMCAAMDRFNAERQHDDLLVKIGLHEGPCLAVMLNERLDYFGQSVNIAARVQGLAEAKTILVTEPIVANPKSAELLGRRGLVPRPQRANLKGIKDEMTVFAIR